MGPGGQIEYGGHSYSHWEDGAPDQGEQYREAARYVDRILKGASPSDLPVRYPGRYYLTINKSAARGSGRITGNTEVS